MLAVAVQAGITLQMAAQAVQAVAVLVVGLQM
jgi:hypothetical protein